MAEPTKAVWWWVGGVLGVAVLLAYTSGKKSSASEKQAVAAKPGSKAVAAKPGSKAVVMFVPPYGVPASAVGQNDFAYQSIDGSPTLQAFLEEGRRRGYTVVVGDEPLENTDVFVTPYAKVWSALLSGESSFPGRVKTVLIDDDAHAVAPYILHHTQNMRVFRVGFSEEISGSQVVTGLWNSVDTLLKPYY